MRSAISTQAYGAALDSLLCRKRTYRLERLVKHSRTTHGLSSASRGLVVDLRKLRDDGTALRQRHVGRANQLFGAHPAKLIFSSPTPLVGVKAYTRAKRSRPRRCPRM